jgi:hypothetical protein
MICRMLDRDPEQRPTARQIQLKLLPCTCCSTVVTAIENTEHTTPLYPSSVESALGKDENSNIILRTTTTMPEIATDSDSEEPLFLKMKSGAFQDLHKYLTVIVIQTRRKCLHDGVVKQKNRRSLLTPECLVTRLASELRFPLRYQDLI